MTDIVKTKEATKDLLRIIFTSWKLHEESCIEDRYTKTQEECMLEACEGDEVLAAMLGLYTEWPNDLIDLAPHFGIALEIEGEGTLNITYKINENVPPAPSSLHYWQNGQWILEEEDDLDVEAAA